MRDTYPKSTNMSGSDGRRSWRNQSTGFVPGTCEMTGNQPSWTANTTIRTTPITNSGRAITERPAIVMTRSSALP